jgi:general secretion pathway protein G
MLRTQGLKNSLRSQQGMTLIEILIVLTIIAGLAAFIYNGVFKNAAKAKVQETKIVMGKLSQALQLYYVDCNRYPSSLDGLMQNTGNECPNFVQAYLDKIPKDGWGREFLYEGSTGNYTLKSLGKDGNEGGTGIDSDISSEDLDK